MNSSVAMFTFEGTLFVHLNTLEWFMSIQMWHGISNVNFSLFFSFFSCFRWTRKELTVFVVARFSWCGLCLGECFYCTCKIETNRINLSNNKLFIARCKYASWYVCAWPGKVTRICPIQIFHAHTRAHIGICTKSDRDIIENWHHLRIYIMLCRTAIKSHTCVCYCTFMYSLYICRAQVNLRTGNSIEAFQYTSSINREAEKRNWVWVKEWEGEREGEITNRDETNKVTHLRHCYCEVIKYKKMR